MEGINRLADGIKNKINAKKTHFFVLRKRGKERAAGFYSFSSAPKGKTNHKIRAPR